MNVLDHGYVHLVESWGSDERIIEAARMSTQKGFEGWGPKPRKAVCPKHGQVSVQSIMLDETDVHEYVHIECGAACDVESESGDEKLLGYLWRNNHATPFEMAGAIVEVQAPIFVFREWHRHRTQSYNEMSARYTPLPDVNYIPSVERLMLNGGTNKQAGVVSGSAQLSETQAERFRTTLDLTYQRAQTLYEDALNQGVPKELARVVLPVGRYSRMRASANLRNWLGFLTLRIAPQAQWEIRQYAEAMHKILAPLFPRTVGLFDEGRNRSDSAMNPKEGG